MAYEISGPNAAERQTSVTSAEFERILEKCISVDEYDSFIYPTQIKRLNNKPVNGQGIYVLYWCQGAPRNQNNLALEYAIQKANDHALSLLVCTGALIGYPLASERHAAFMLEGLQEFKQELAYDRGIRLFVGKNSPDNVAIQFAKYAVEIIVDKNYLRVQRQRYDRVAQEINCALTQIECNSVIPVEVISSEEMSDFDVFKEKLYRHVEKYLKPITKILPEHNSLDLTLPPDADYDELNIYEIDHALELLNLDRTVKRVVDYSGGYCSALACLNSFITERLPVFESQHRDNPGHDLTSKLSGHMNFGHISCIDVVLAVKNAGVSEQAKDFFLDRVFVQRHLAFNAAFYNQQYDSLFGNGLPTWALSTIKRHASDRRPYVYSLKTLEAAETNDPLWNAAQLEMVYTARMHTFIRFYWGKKVIEWTPDMDTAFNYLVYLNDKYQMDGRHPCSYAGIAQCFGKYMKPNNVEIPIFGTILDLHINDLKDSYCSDIDVYIQRCYTLAGRPSPPSVFA